MRIKVAAKDFKEGMIAFLPYWGKLRKAKIVRLSDLMATKAGNKRSVVYKLVSGDDMEQGQSYHSAIVQWVELNPGVEDLYVVCTDEGHKGRGVYDGDYDADMQQLHDDFT